MTNVTKADGNKQPFEKSKIVRTCLRMKASKDAAEEIADRIERRLYEGIRTKQILKMIFSYLGEYRPELKHQIDLREAVCLLRPKPDFEQFVGLLLKYEGYDVRMNKILAGKCIEHEIDAIATNDNETLYVEVKHHYQPHSYTGVGVFLEAQATLEDLNDGKNNFTKAMVVTNAKLSEHAMTYARCKNIDAMGWRYPEEKSLELMIEDNKLYPVTLIKGLDVVVQAKLGDNGIVLLEQLIQYDTNKLSKLTKVGKSKINEILRKANEILE